VQNFVKYAKEVLFLSELIRDCTVLWLVTYLLQIGYGCSTSKAALGYMVRYTIQ